MHRHHPHNTIYTIYKYFIPEYLYKNVCRANSLEKCSISLWDGGQISLPMHIIRNIASLRGKGWMGFSAAPYNVGKVRSSVLFRGHRQTTQHLVSAPHRLEVGGRGSPGTGEAQTACCT